jgi:transcriptional regulator with XRE-family HTH domain
MRNPPPPELLAATAANTRDLLREFPSVRAAAKALGVARSRLAAWRDGKAAPDAEPLLRMMEFRRSFALARFVEAEAETLADEAVRQELLGAARDLRDSLRAANGHGVQRLAWRGAGPVRGTEAEVASLGDGWYASLGVRRVYRQVRSDGPERWATDAQALPQWPDET